MVKKFYECLREHTMKTINFENKENDTLRSKEYEPYLWQTVTFAKKVWGLIHY